MHRFFKSNLVIMSEGEIIIPMIIKFSDYLKLTRKFLASELWFTHYSLYSSNTRTLVTLRENLRLPFDNEYWLGDAGVNSFSIKNFIWSHLLVTSQATMNCYPKCYVMVSYLYGVPVCTEHVVRRLCYRSWIKKPSRFTYTVFNFAGISDTSGSL